jgi:nucleoside-diphosphate-sugar epimerase
MKVLVTGGLGRVGRYVVAEFAQAGHEVVVFDQAMPREPINNVRYRVGDHEDLGQVTEVCVGMDAVVHLSAIPGPRTYSNAIVFRTNVMGTFNVHEAAVMVGVPLVISTSSQSAYGFAWQHRPFLPHYLPMDEDHPDLSQDSYGLSKMTGELIAHGFHRRCDLRVCSIRPPWVVVPEEYETAVRQSVVEPLTEWTNNVFAYLDVRDLAVAYRLVAEASPELIQDEVFNVCADDALTVESLRTLLPRLNPAFENMVTQLGENQSMVSASRIQRVLGWRPRYSWRDIISV